jgi:protein-tyrosine phosphatase
MVLPKNTLLFLCTGNYYRSRFAEILFNAQATRLALPWQALSRGLATELISRDYGPISSFAINGLEQRGISLNHDVRYPIQLEEADLLQADRVIALYEAEHRPYLESRFPGWENRIEYWNVPDRDKASVDEALAMIEDNVRRLISEISKSAVYPSDK